MVKYICFCQMRPAFLKMSTDERKKEVLRWGELAEKHDLKVLFWGSTMGIREHAVLVFEADGYSENYMEFQREWQGLGTSDAGKYIDYTRTVTVF